MSGYSGSSGKDRWPSVKAAIKAGKSSTAHKRISNCVPKTLQWTSLFNQYRKDIPLAFMVVKAAFESCGKADALTKSGKDIGLFQLFPIHFERNGLTPTQGLDPANNTRIFVKVLDGRAASFEKSHGSWFPNGRDWSFWGIMWLTAGIGPGATRHLLNQVSQGPGAFNKIVSFVSSHPGWMEEYAQDAKWGVQSGRLVAFRVMVAWDVVGEIRKLEASGELEEYVTQPVPGVPRGGDLGRIFGITLAVLGSASSAALVGWTAYQGLRRKR